MKTVGIIMAAGKGSRMNPDDGKNKVFLKFGGESALGRCIEAHVNTGLFSEIIVVCRKEDENEIAEVARVYAGSMKWSIVIGGKERQDSVANALSQLSDDTDYVSIHDAARCFVTEKTIADCVMCARRYGTAVPVSPVIDTVKQTDGDKVIKTLDRKELVLVQTPQVFSAPLLIEAYEKAYADGYYGTDDASLVEHLGMPVHIVSGDRDNIKITTREDIARGRAIAGNDSPDMRIGNGFDVHAFVAGRKLILGGVDIPFEKGLDGHSDADVLIHAVMDALLGASGLPDIGQLFPPSDDTYKDISSLVLLSEVRKKMEEAGCSIVNIDATLMMQAPKIAEYREQMIINIAGTLGIPREAVNIKGTTTEHLGFVGRQEGICASAVCLMKR